MLFRPMTSTKETCRQEHHEEAKHVADGLSSNELTVGLLCLFYDAMMVGDSQADRSQYIHSEKLITRS